MAALKQFDMTTGEHSKSDNLLYRFIAVPPTFFSITMGLAGLAGAWRLAGNLYGFPVQIGDILYLTTAMVPSAMLCAMAQSIIVYFTAKILLNK